MSIDQSFPENSPLRRAIASALERRGKRAAGIVVSIMREAEWFQPRGSGEEVWIKWLCWNLVSRNGYNVTRPALGFVHGELSEDTLRRAIRHWFPGHRCVVNNDIKIGE